MPGQNINGKNAARVVKVDPMRIVQIKTNERDGYTALQVTYGHRDAKKLTKPAAGHFEKAGVAPGKRLVELRLDSVDQGPQFLEIKAEWFFYERVFACLHC